MPDTLLETVIKFVRSFVRSIKMLAAITIMIREKKVIMTMTF